MYIYLDHLLSECISGYVSMVPWRSHHLCYKGYAHGSLRHDVDQRNARENGKMRDHDTDGHVALTVLQTLTLRGDYLLVYEQEIAGPLAHGRVRSSCILTL